MAIKGNKTPVFSFKIGSASAVDFGGALRSVSFGDGEGEATTFNDYATGVRPVAVTLTADLEFGTGKLFNFLTTNSGASNVTWEYRVSDETPSASNPKFSGTCTLPAKPLPSVEAGNDKQSFEVEIQLDAFNMSES